MALVLKVIKGKTYYYSFLSYFLLDKPKSFSKYVGTTRPSRKKLRKVEDSFKDELILRLAKRNYSQKLLSKDDVIKTLLFANLFAKKYGALIEARRRKYDIDSTVSFTLTTLTTEDVDIGIADVRNALRKKTHLTDREKISGNMLKAIGMIKKQHRLDRRYLLNLHKTIMSSFEGKAPGTFRRRQVYLHRHDGYGSVVKELSYRPPPYDKMDALISDFLDWYNTSDLNPIEKASLAHYKLYRIHPFLDGNKRVCRLILNKVLLSGNLPLLNISLQKEAYFEALINSIEKDRPAVFVGFTLSQYYKQLRGFLSER